MVEMPDYNKPLDEDPAVVKVNSSPSVALLGVALRQIGLVGGGVASIYSYLDAHDIRGLFTYLGSHEFLVILLMIGGFVATAWGYVNAWLHKKKLTEVADTSPSNIVMVNEGFWYRLTHLFSGDR